MRLEELLPMSLEQFNDEYRQKKFLVVKSKDNIFKDYFSWREADAYLNSYGLNGWDRFPQ